jgi:hypothetical protein
MPQRIIRFVLCALLTTSVAHAQQCLHGTDEAPDQRARRLAGIRVIREVNARQADLWKQRGKFGSLNDVKTAVSGSPVGFVPRVTVDQWGYTIFLKDSLDSCGFGLASDQDGIIYEVRPVSTDRLTSYAKDPATTWGAVSNALPNRQGEAARSAEATDPRRATPGPEIGERPE